MRKVGLKRIIPLAVIMTLFMSITAFAANVTTENRNFAYLNTDYSGGQKNMSAGTVRISDPNGYTSLFITTTYDDGSENDYYSGVVHYDATKVYDYQWAEDYSSTHKWYHSAYDTPFDVAHLSE